MSSITQSNISTDNNSDWKVVSKKRRSKKGSKNSSENDQKLSVDAAPYVMSRQSDTRQIRRNASPKTDFPRKTQMYSDDKSVIGHLLRTADVDFSGVSDKIVSGHLRGGNGTVHFGGVRFTRGTTLVDATSAIESLHKYLGELLSASKKVVSKKKHDNKARFERKQVQRQYAPRRGQATLADFISM